MKKLINSRLSTIAATLMIGTLSTASLLYVTPDTQAEVMGKDYIEASNSFFKDRTLLTVVSKVDTDKPEIFQVLVVRVQKKATKTKPAHEVMSVTKVGGEGGGGDPYDDKEIRDQIEAIKPYDDKEIREQIAAIKPYDDKEIREQIAAIKPYDDAPLVERLAALEGALTAPPVIKTDV